MLRDALVSILADMLSLYVPISKKTVIEMLEKNKLLDMDIANQKSINEKIEQLASSLHKSSELMQEIEHEFMQQRIIAEKWKDEAETYQSIAQLNQNEVEAVRKIFGQHVSAESKKSYRLSILWGAIFCIIGVIGGFLLSILIV